jgi:hypothetical protein
LEVNQEAIDRIQRDIDWYNDLEKGRPSLLRPSVESVPEFCPDCNGIKESPLGGGAVGDKGLCQSSYHGEFAWKPDVDLSNALESNRLTIDYAAMNQMTKDWTPVDLIVPAPDKTTYTVPPHVGQNVEVPEGSTVTTYDPKDSYSEATAEMVNKHLAGMIAKETAYKLAADLASKVEDKLKDGFRDYVPDTDHDYIPDTHEQKLVTISVGLNSLNKNFPFYVTHRDLPGITLKIIGVPNFSVDGLKRPSNE